VGTTAGINRTDSAGSITAAHVLFNVATPLEPVSA
jgi:hypothetical protein